MASKPNPIFFLRAVLLIQTLEFEQSSKPTKYVYTFYFLNNKVGLVFFYFNSYFLLVKLLDFQVVF